MQRNLWLKNRSHSEAAKYLFLTRMADAPAAGGSDEDTENRGGAKNVAILLFPDVELLDFAGPLEVFSSVTAAGGNPDIEATRLCRVYTVAESLDVVRCINPLSVMPQFTLECCPKPHVFIVPGGIGTRPAAKSAALVSWIRRTAASCDVTASVCTGSLLLAEAGLLQGRAATTHRSMIHYFRTSFPDVQVRENVRWVDEGDVVTSAGVTAGIDMAFHLVNRMFGKDVMLRTANAIEYDLK